MHTPGPCARSRRFSYRLHRSFFHRCALAAALIVPAAVPAQPPFPPATAVQGDAALPDVPVAPPRHAALPPWPADAPLVDWRDAHAAVATFPRGHADIAAWEARQGRSPAAGASTATRAPDHAAHAPAVPATAAPAVVPPAVVEPAPAMHHPGHASVPGHHHGSDPNHGATPAGGHQP
ncbi:hypothetical protein Acav_1749 [Paracidovorax avenae ATCC 19860]|uniref:Uncharacterized protein n=1 Tax=Paracidovorax avenae (strain ATCC 19860 / DSM 7227 / CCUG 15838 / JCM 20985 / LMG 2117 / NCPPB 1011) TaxID=643561 RepID=F0Q6B4_PARA1|nr:hypothetical protein [Paracidovorax avenae]ADX45667.1 hypothetical protein Acav_1749 [Paracidovorax avenae ATCC 19860]